MYGETNFKNAEFHLTVTRSGLVSLWDSEAQARSVTDETYVSLQLTSEQVAALKLAATQAKR